jgi:hypothetical protein
MFIYYWYKMLNYIFNWDGESKVKTNLEKSVEIVKAEQAKLKRIRSNSLDETELSQKQMEHLKKYNKDYNSYTKNLLITKNNL